jgi:hypothetical protein
VDQFNNLIFAVFASDCLPPYLIVFGFIQLLERTPKEVVVELSSIPLDRLLRTLEEKLTEVFAPHEAIVRRSFERLKAVMRQRKRLGDLPLEQATRAVYRHLLGRVVAETTLRELFREANYKEEPHRYDEKSGATITKWWVTVRRRVISDLGGRP